MKNVFGQQVSFDSPSSGWPGLRVDVASSIVSCVFCLGRTGVGRSRGKLALEMSEFVTV